MAPKPADDGPEGAEGVPRQDTPAPEGAAAAFCREKKAQDERIAQNIRRAREGWLNQVRIDSIALGRKFNPREFEGLDIEKLAEKAVQIRKEALEMNSLDAMVSEEAERQMLVGEAKRWKESREGKNWLNRRVGPDLALGEELLLSELRSFKNAKRREERRKQVDMDG
jgi:hypothetical protein